MISSFEETRSRSPRRKRYVVCAEGELAAGEIREVQAGRRSIAVVRLEGGTYRAVANSCPHEAAKFSRGKVERMWVSGGPGEHRASERCVVICPWHNFEFDVETGRFTCEPDRMRIKTYPVRVECGEVAVYV